MGRAKVFILDKLHIFTREQNLCEDAKFVKNEDFCPVRPYYFPVLKKLRFPRNRPATNICLHNIC